MTSLRFILVAFAILFFGTLFGADRASKPNIVFFFIDDLGWTDLGYMGSKYYESPHIDKLAKDGMVFMNAYANAPNCAPSRACLMSGKYSPRHGVYTVGNSDRGSSKYRKLIPIKNTTHLSEKFVTMGEALQAVGYVTATMGKWHLGDDPTTQGFDVNVAGKSWGSPSGGGYHSPYKYPNLENKEKGEYLTDRLGVEACKFIETNKDKPFFLYLTHYAVHTPIQAKPELKKKYQAKKPTERHKNAAYAAMIESTDDSVGAVLATLDRLELADDTLVIFFSDNGGHGGVTSNAPLRGSKGMLYEGGIREPMIVKWLGVTKPGSICRENVIGIDLYPTPPRGYGITRPQGLRTGWRKHCPSPSQRRGQTPSQCHSLALSSIPAGLHRPPWPFQDHPRRRHPHGRLEAHRVLRRRRSRALQYRRRSIRDEESGEGESRENKGTSRRHARLA